MKIRLEYDPENKDTCRGIKIYNKETGEELHYVKEFVFHPTGKS